MQTPRDQNKTTEYYRRLIDYRENTVGEFKSMARNTNDPQHRRRLMYSIFREEFELWIIRYSAGEELPVLKNYFVNVINSLEDYQQQEGFEAVDFRGLSDYIQSLWMISISILMEMSEQQLIRIIDLINQNGLDGIYDRLIRLRFPDNAVSNSMLHPVLYVHLYKAIMAEGGVRNNHILAFLENYSSGIKGVYWADKEKEGTFYFKYWIFELAAFVKGLNIEDNDFRNNGYYPADLTKNS